MRKKILLLLPLCLLALLAVWAAAAGDAGDPLASLSYLNGAFTEKVDAAVKARLDSLEPGGETGAPPAGTAAVWSETRMKQDDQLRAGTGSGVLLLAGGGRVNYAAGVVVDATEGTVLPSGGSLTPRHRYLVAEDTTAEFTVTSKTAVLDWQGECTFYTSASADYNAMASALKALHLFQGSYTGYGQGFDLEAAPTRLQALIMFIRVLGEESEALAWNGSCPFTDVQPGTNGEKYVGYAYERGYTNGYSATQFRPSAAVNAYQYTEFLLRAMGYSNADNTVLSDALLRARDADLLTPGEAAALEQGPFLRADLAYLSYYTLDTLLADGRQTLAESLIERGAFSLRDWEDASAQVTGWRL